MDLLYDFDRAKIPRKCMLFDLALLQRVIFSRTDATLSKQ